jgi:pyridoxamine-phosphate oxidase
MTASVQTLSGDGSLRLPEFDEPPADPTVLMREWFDSALRREVREPFAAVLATADAAGRPSTRVLLVKDLDDRGLVFTSFRGSRKGQDLAGRPWASMTFYWRETLQQLSVRGAVEEVTDGEADELFARRPLAAQATTAVSRQSHPLQDEDGLRERARQLLAAGEPLKRPAQWTGYRLVPDSIEFWYGSPDRLHRRLRYDRPTPESPSWTHQRLQP